MRLLLQGHVDLPQRVTLDVVLKDPHPNPGDGGEEAQFVPHLSLVLRMSK